MAGGSCVTRFGEINGVYFAGGGGSTIGIERAGQKVHHAINHAPEAIAVHAANHPHIRHVISDIREVDPVDVTEGRPMGLAWFSPDCRHFSRAKGSAPVSKRIRGLAWIVLRFAARARPRVIMLENVEEFQTWGPVKKGRPIKERSGETFALWKSHLEALGYRLEMRRLIAKDYGVPTIRKRLFIIARCDGLPIIWPKPSHGPGLKPYRSAAEIIDFSRPCPSIFMDRVEARAFTKQTGIRVKRPLVEATMRRIAVGISKFVINHSDPFIIPVTHQGDSMVYNIREPLRTVTGAHRGEFALVQPFVTRQFGKSTGSPIHDPVGTLTAGGGGKTALVAAFLAQHNTGAVGRPADAPLATLTSKARLGLVTVHGQDYQITDIGMRMLTIGEQAAAMGLPTDYDLKTGPDGKELTLEWQQKLVGNMVCPDIAEALVRANCAVNSDQMEMAI